MMRKFLFDMEPEKAHEIAMHGMNLVHRLHLNKKVFGEKVQQPVKVMGINFPNAVGLAAGLDKNGDYYEALADCGFGFVEIGTVTPRPQPGNPKPRLFRLPEAEAIINRMGFNNKGVDYLLDRVKQSSYKGVLGINIGKNFDTPVERAVDDYVHCLHKVYAYADYVTVNISSPNTPGLRDLQFGDALKQLLTALKDEQARQSDLWSRYVPIAIKIAPDMDDEAIEKLTDTFAAHKVDAIIATNTTFSREGVEGLPYADEQGGLSGRPVKNKSDHVLQVMAAHLQGEIPVIAVGGIFSGKDAVHKMHLGASLVQVYTGFVYRGPELIREIAQSLVRNASSSA
ncbi:MAG TPA: quinone-dependent dihydroorotate dehydrogenase [Gammaproteobacteria bacterium]